MDLRQNLKSYREKAGYKTAKEFAVALGIPYNTYTAYENQKREPKLDMLVKIADLLEVSTDELLGRENNNLSNKDDEKIKELFNDALKAFDYNLIQLSDINEQEVSFYLGTNLKYGKIKVKKDFFVNCFNSAIAKGNEIKRILIFNTVITKIFNTAVEELTNDIKNNEQIIQAYQSIKAYKKEELTINELHKNIAFMLKDGTSIEELNKDIESITLEEITAQLDKLIKKTQSLKDIQIITLRFQNYSENLRQEISITKKQRLFDEKAYKEVLENL